jgi:hypothetical protein
MNEIKGLIIDTPHIDNILSGKKTWEMRSTQAKRRGLVALIRKGSGKIIGIARMVDSLGPFSKTEMLANQSRHMISAERLADPKIEKWNNAWVMQDAKIFATPMSYVHPNGAVIWVNLDEKTQRAIRDAALI